MSSSIWETVIAAYLIFILSSQVGGTVGYYRAKGEMTLGVITMIAVVAWTAVVIVAHWRLGFWH